MDSCSREYQAAYGAVNEDDKRLQNLIYEMEFAKNKAERNKVATRLQRSRRNRRKNKDIVMRNELVVKFFDEQNHKSTLNKMRQLLGRQWKGAGGQEYSGRLHRRKCLDYRDRCGNLVIKNHSS